MYVRFYATFACYCRLFWLDNVDYLSIILELYHGMIQIKGVDKDIIQRALKKKKIR